MAEVSKYDIYDEVLTVTEVARFLKVERRAVERWINSGKLEATKTPNGRIKILRSKLDKAMREINGDNWP